MYKAESKKLANFERTEHENEKKEQEKELEKE